MRADLAAGADRVGWHVLRDGQFDNCRSGSAYADPTQLCRSLRRQSDRHDSAQPLSSLVLAARVPSWSPPCLATRPLPFIFLSPLFLHGDDVGAARARRWETRAPRSSRGHQRRAEAVATLFGVASDATLTACLVEGARRRSLKASVRGRDVAWGVSRRGSGGFGSLGLALVTVARCAGGSRLHRGGLALRTTEPRAPSRIVLTGRAARRGEPGGGVLYALPRLPRGACDARRGRGTPCLGVGASGGARTTAFAIFAGSGVTASRSRSRRVGPVRRSSRPAG